MDRPDSFIGIGVPRQVGLRSPHFPRLRRSWHARLRENSVKLGKSAYVRFWLQGDIIVRREYIRLPPESSHP